MRTALKKYCVIMRFPVQYFVQYHINFEQSLHANKRNVISYCIRLRKKYRHRIGIHFHISIHNFLLTRQFMFTVTVILRLCHKFKTGTIIKAKLL